MYGIHAMISPVSTDVATGNPEKSAWEPGMANDHMRSIAMAVVLLGFIGAAFAGSVEPVEPIVPEPIEQAPLFTNVGQSDIESMPQYSALWSIAVNEVEIRQPAQSIRLNGPGFPEIDVPLLSWSPRTGYIEMYNDNDPDHPIIIPDPEAGPEDFSWNWYGKVDHFTVSLTVERGVLAGRIWLRDRRFALRPSANGLLLGETRSDYWRTHPKEDQENADTAPLYPQLHHRQLQAVAGTSPVLASRRQGSTLSMY